MKQKTIYMLAIVCCMSFFSSAKQNGKNCDKTTSSSTQNKLKAVKQERAIEKDPAGFDLSPLQVFVFGI